MPPAMAPMTGIAVCAAAPVLPELDALPVRVALSRAELAALLRLLSMDERLAAAEPVAPAPADERADEASLLRELKAELRADPTAGLLGAKDDAMDWTAEDAPPATEESSPPRDETREDRSWAETAPAPRAATKTVEKRIVMWCRVE